MSLLRTALALSLLLGTSAEEPQKLHRAKGHLRHHKHHGHHKHNSPGLWSHGQKFELVLPESEDAGLVKLARKAVKSAPIADSTVEAKVTQTAPDNAGNDQLQMAQEVVDPRPAFAKAHAREAKVSQTAPDNAGDDQLPMAQEVVDPRPAFAKADAREEVVDPNLHMQESEKATWAKAYAREVQKIQNKEKAAKEAASVAKIAGKVSATLKTATDQKSQHEEAVDPRPAFAKADAREAKVTQTAPDNADDDQLPMAQEAVDPRPAFAKADAREGQIATKVSAALKTATDQKSQHEDDQSHSTKQASRNTNTQAQGFAKIRQELRLAKKKDRQVKALNKHLDAQLDILFKSSELQKSVKSDEESAQLLEQQTSQLKTMAEQTKMRISESKEVAHNAARLAAQQAEAMRDAARAEEKKAEEQLQKSKKAEVEAEKLDKIALKELRKIESKPKGAWIQENATVAN